MPKMSVLLLYRGRGVVSWPSGSICRKTPKFSILSPPESRCQANDSGGDACRAPCSLALPDPPGWCFPQICSVVCVLNNLTLRFVVMFSGVDIFGAADDVDVCVSGRSPSSSQDSESSELTF